MRTSLIAPPPIGRGKLIPLTEQIGPQFETFLLAPQRAHHLTAPAMGLHLQVPPYAFSNAEGGTIDQPVTFRLKVLTHKLHLLLNGKATLAEGRLLNGLCTCLLEASMGDRPLQLSEPVAFTFSLPPEWKSSNGLRLYQESTSDIHLLDRLPFMEWKRSGGVLSPPQKKNGHYLSGVFKKLGWYHIGRPLLRRKNLVHLGMRAMHPGVTFTEQSAYLVFDRYHTLLPLYGKDGKFLSTKFPATGGFTALSIGFEHEHLYYGALHIAKPEAGVIQVPMEKVSLSRLQQRLRHLPAFSSQVLR